MPEEFIHYIWENRLFFIENLKTTDGEPLEIIDVGKRNRDSGPDFFNAKININNILWIGNVEIHKKASDWKKHKHISDKAYDNVILHVVEENDMQIYRNNGTQIATLIMDWPDHYNNNYLRLIKSRTWIPCQDQFHRIDAIFMKLCYHRLMIERLQDKTSQINNIMKKNQNNWNETFYQILARMLGFKINSVPFELLAKSVPLKILFKHKKNLFQLESLLFGASGMLDEEITGDNYYTELRKEFNFLRKKYKLKPIGSHLWKFMRLHPANFPSIRISQLAGIIYHSDGLFSKIITIENFNDLQKLFRVKASDYWNSHYKFNITVPHSCSKVIGIASVNIIIINVVIPFLFVYGEEQNQFHLRDRALDFLEKLPPENNSIIRKWRKLGVNPQSAFETQALLQLKTIYCERKKCLNCQIGNKLIKYKS
jgi:uncharacterized protein YciU (UPF0263 family)